MSKLNAAILTLTVLMSPAARGAEAGPIWGVNGHPLTSYPGITLDQQLDLVAELGMTSYRVDVTSLDQLDRLDALITAAKARGLTILPILIPPIDLKTQSPEELTRRARQFGEAVAGRFSGRVPVWELGNELEIFALIHPCEMRDDGTQYPCEWGIAGGVGPLDYVGARVAKVAAVLKGLSEAVAARDPKARRALGTAGWGHIGIFERLRDSGVPWDISVWHMYGGDSEWAFRLIAAFGKPIWITEFNHPLGSGKDGEAKQAEALADTMTRLRSLAPHYAIEAAFIYELCDEPYWAPSGEAAMGLVQLKADPKSRWTLGDRKIAYQAVRRVIALGSE